MIKGTVGVISREPLYKDGNARFTMLLLKLFLLKYELDTKVYNLENLIFSVIVSLQK